MGNLIELEYRSEIAVLQFEKFRKIFEKKFKLISHTQRLSYMGFKSTKDESWDLRSRVTNGEAEVVLKIGKLHASDRIEISQPISKRQLAGFAKIFSHLTDESYVAERETYNFKSKNGVVISLVRASHTAYIEFEILSKPNSVKTNDRVIKSLIAELGLKIISENEFNDLNMRLSNKDDWKFIDQTKDIQRLSKLLSQY